MYFAFFLMLVYVGQAQAEVTLQQVVASALARDVQKEWVATHEYEAAALIEFSKQFFASAPAISAEYSEDSATSNVGARKGAMSLELPLWWPGQRRAASKVGDKAFTRAERFAIARALQIAGEVREAIASVALAKARLASAGHEARHAGEIARDQKKRFALGEASRQDWLLAEQSQKRFQEALKLAEAEIRKSEAAYRVLTGLDEYPKEESLVPPAIPHPFLHLADAEEDLAHTQIVLAQRSQIDNPLLTLGTSRERGIAADPYASNLMVGVRIPFGGKAFNAPQVAKAQRDWAWRDAEKKRIVRQVALDQEQAQSELAGVKEALKASEERLALARETTRLAELAYKSGEQDFLDYLKIEGERADAEMAYALHLAEYSRAIARLNQANGVVP